MVTCTELEAIWGALFAVDCTPLCHAVPPSPCHFPSLKVMLDALRMRLSSSGSGGSGEEATHELRSVLHLLHAAPGLPVQARHHCVALLSSVLEALSGPACAPALGCAELRDQVAEATLAFLATCCHDAVAAAG